MELILNTNIKMIRISNLPMLSSTRRTKYLKKII